VNALSNTKIETIKNGCTNSHRLLNKRLSRIILYGKQKQALIDRCIVLQRCVEEISRIQENDKYESCKFVFFLFRIYFWLIVSLPKIMLLYGGDVHHIKSIHRLMNIELDQRKFGLVIIRVY